MRNLDIDIIVRAVISGLIIWILYEVVKKYIITPGYPEIYEYEKRFMKAKNEEFEALREDIFKEFDDVSEDEIYDLEIKINIEIDDLNKGNTIYSTITMITFIIGICINNLNVNDLGFAIVLILAFIILSFFFIYSKKNRNYNKYLVFLKELTKRYKDIKKL